MTKLEAEQLAVDIAKNIAVISNAGFIISKGQFCILCASLHLNRLIDINQNKLNDEQKNNVKKLSFLINNFKL